MGSASRTSMADTEQSGLSAGHQAAAGIFGTLLILLVLAGLLYLIRRWMQGPARVSEDVKLEGKTVVITGANTGIGKATAMDMSRRGAKVVILCRDMEKAEAAAAEVRDVTKGEVICHRLDLADLASVRELARKGEGSGVAAYALHPGVIATDLGRHMENMNCFTKMI